MNFLSVLYAKAGITVDGVTTLNNTATALTPATNDNSTNIATTGYVKNQNYYPYPTGTTSQYVRGDGSLATFTQTGGGGSSVSYYLNGGTSQGTIGGNTYYEMSKNAIIGTNADFTINANGYIAQFVTDAGDPALLNIPGGNWNFEMFFSASSGGGSPSFYVQLYKYDGTTLTLIASGSAVPESITGGTSIDLYVTALAVPTTTLTLTDRLAVRVYVTHSGRTITLHTQDSHLCQVITTFTTGLTALNGLTAQVQNFAVGTGGSDFAISSVTDTHTFNLPTASATKRGALSSIDWSAFDAKVDFGDLSATSPLNYNGSGVFSIAQSSTSTNGYLSSTDWTTFNNKQNALTLTTTGTSGAATLVGSTLNIPNYGTALASYLPLAGGTLTGALNGTSANFTGNLTVDTNTFFVDSVNNRVGIGTASPLSGLMHLYGAAGASAVRWSEAAVTVGFVGGANGLVTGKNGSFMVRGESGLVLSGQGNGNSMFIDSTGDIQTKAAADTGEHFIIGGTARVNGALASTSTINGVGINAGTINASAYGLLTSANTTYSGTANLLALGTIDGTYNPRVIVSYTTLAGNPALLKFDSTYSSGWGATNYSFATGIVMIGSATVSGSAALQVTGAVTISGALTGSSTAQFTKIGIGNAPSATSFIFSNVNPTGGTSISAWRGIFSASNDVTSRLNGVSIAVGTQASTTISDIVAYNAEGTSFGAGSSVTRVTGFSADSTLANALATNVYGFQGSIASGTNRWNLYMVGTAANYLAGNLQVGSTTPTAGAEKLQVTGTASISGAATFGSSVTAVSLSLTTGNFNLGTSSNAGVVNMYNASTVPSASITNGVILYAQDVDPGTGASSELKVRDEAGNITTLSPHNFSLIPNGPSEELAWSYYSEKKGKKINVDMLKLARLVESLTDEQLVFIQ